MPREFFVYIATNKRNTVLYTGVTNNIGRRMFEHSNKLSNGFTSKYNVDKLIYCEALPTALEAIGAEKTIKGWTRKKKIDFVEKENPEWKDLLEDYSDE